jgi:hypothetical protein
MVRQAADLRQGRGKLTWGWLSKTVETLGRDTVPNVEIVVKGRIDEHWSQWLEGLAITHGERDETVLVGEVIDQSALYGLLTKLRDMGLPLLAVRCEGMVDEQAGALDRSDWPPPGAPEVNGGK